jgi:hypothetical protein
VVPHVQLSRCTAPLSASARPHALPAPDRLGSALMCHRSIKVEDSSGRPKFNNVTNSDEGFDNGLMVE